MVRQYRLKVVLLLEYLLMQKVYRVMLEDMFLTLKDIRLQLLVVILMQKVKIQKLLEKLLMLKEVIL